MRLIPRSVPLILLVLAGCESLTLVENDSAAPTSTTRDRKDAAQLAIEKASTPSQTIDHLSSIEEAQLATREDDGQLGGEIQSTAASIDQAELDPPSEEVESSTEASPLETDLFARIRQGFSLDHRLDHPRVQSQAAWFRKNPAYLDRVFNRSRPYLHYIVDSVESADLPLEIALLPLVESAFDPFAYSHGRASGLWQFIPGTARLYGLTIDWWFDGRRDVIDSTDAAIRYLAKLNEQFKGDWPLALAAYNSGIGNVRKAIRRQNRAPDRATFWDLDLPRETEAYVPKLLAIAALVRDPAAFDYELPHIANEAIFTEVATGHQIDLDLAASLAGISVETIYRFNPGLNQWATHPEGPHRLIVPIQVAETFGSKLASLDEADRVRWERYTIRSGDTLSQIALRFGVSTNVLMQQNDLATHRIRAGQTLLIPRPVGAASPLSAPGRLNAKQQRFAEDPDRLEIDYLVREGDSLWKIARMHDTTVRQIARWNQIGEKSPIQVGQRIKLYPKKKDQTTKPPALTQRPQIERTISYVVRQGDSFGRIANRFQVSIADLKAWNPELAQTKYLQPGDRVSVRVNVQNLIR